jgi:hypothetical protein
MQVVDTTLLGLVASCEPALTSPAGAASAEIDRAPAVEMVAEDHGSSWHRGRCRGRRVPQQ